MNPEPMKGTAPNGAETYGKITPGPWHSKPSAVYETVYSKKDGEIICFAAMRPNARANAEFIVRSCNSYDDMLVALRRAVLALAFAAESSPAMRDDYNAVSDAIAKATGAQS